MNKHHPAKPASVYRPLSVLELWKANTRRLVVQIAKAYDKHFWRTRGVSSPVRWSKPLPSWDD